MKILYDHQTFAMQKIGGVSRYFYELISRIGLSSGIVGLCSLKYTNNEYMLNYSTHSGNVIERIPTYNDYFPSVNFKGKKLLYKIARKIVPGVDKSKINYNSSVNLLQNQDFDIFHPTYYNPYFLRHIGTKPFVLTVYDLIHEIFSDEYPITDLTQEWKKLLISKASNVIAISENTKKDLVRIYGINGNMISVVYLSSSLNECTTSKPDVGLPEKFLLFVGLRNGYKNFKLLLRALMPLFNKDKELNLICTGYMFTAEEQLQFVEMGIFNRIKHVYVNDTELKYLYQHALAFVFPSRYEGFGIPILEAFSCGCPAVISEGSSMDEVGGDAAMYFNPTDCESMTNALHEVLYSQTLRNEMITRGYKRSFCFSWQKTVEKTAEVYKNLIN